MRTAVVVLVCMLGGVGVAGACPERPESFAAPPASALHMAVVLLICAVVGAGYVFACSNAARLAFFRRTRTRAPSTAIDRDLAARVVQRHGKIAVLLAAGCLATAFVVSSVPLSIASRIAMMIVPSFVAMVALVTACRLLWTAAALRDTATSVRYDGAYYMFIVRNGKMRGWVGALPRSLERAAATTLPKAVVAHL